MACCNAAGHRDSPFVVELGRIIIAVSSLMIILAGYEYFTDGHLQQWQEKMLNSKL